MPFDVVVIRFGDQERRMSADEFMALPLHRRIRHILAREVEFYSGSLPVDRSIALKSLRADAAA